MDRSYVSQQVLDGAAALYLVFTAFVNAVYQEDSCQFDCGSGERMREDISKNLDK
ncbi:MAG: hypothetical protein HFJ06_06900 [Lachnospiraceae bacterium]|nr:hypothetical protein [Lachnospiraceae bacterium]